MKYSTRDKYVRRLREAADFLEQHGHELPGTPVISTEITCYLTHTDYVRNEESGEYEGVLNEETTRDNLRRFLSAVGSCDKDYSDDRLEVRKRGNDGQTLVRGSVDRSVACKRKVVGQKMVQAQMIPARMEDIVEWDCEDGVSLLALTKGL